MALPTFYLVYQVGHAGVSRVHSNPDAAIEDAKRLASEQPGQLFCVFSTFFHAGYRIEDVESCNSEYTFERWVQELVYKQAPPRDDLPPRPPHPDDEELLI